MDIDGSHLAPRLVWLIELSLYLQAKHVKVEPSVPLFSDRLITYLPALYIKKSVGYTPKGAGKKKSRSRTRVQGFERHPISEQEQFEEQEGSGHVKGRGQQNNGFHVVIRDGFVCVIGVFKGGPGPILYDVFRTGTRIQLFVCLERQGGDWGKDEVPCPVGQGRLVAWPGSVRLTR